MLTELEENITNYTQVTACPLAFLEASPPCLEWVIVLFFLLHALKPADYIVLLHRLCFRTSHMFPSL